MLVIAMNSHNKHAQQYLFLFASIPTVQATRAMLLHGWVNGDEEACASKLPA
jgi:hypothetical protein